ncbi:hypothetical protein B0I35DRAFT_407081 [Stachybotrys elegans]|uniref:Uncharacterized protein n=1 Tax=Stachybotrys elegans TaxID=80388 RepID=A0A8K0SU60_9HYPO|nr:hypothetical protein B0I35DRAFT_407081 [Stachybotrys elegans]
MHLSLQATSSRAKALHLAALTTWLCLFLYCSRYAFADPSSAFFQRARAYTPQHSAIREAEADDYVSRLLGKAAHSHSFSGSRSSQKLQAFGEDVSREEICVGIPSLKRDNEQFLRRAVASLLDSLDEKEHLELYLIVLLADQEPDTNPAYGQAWLEYLADEVLIYDKDTSTLPAGLANYRRLPPKDVPPAKRKKHLRLDHAALLQACQRRQAPYFVIIEDDVIASRDWYKRLRWGLDEAESTHSPRDWLYLRLFYSETFLGWHAEEDLIYLRNILLVYFCVSGLTRHMRTYIGVYFWTTAFIALHFMAGRVFLYGYSPGLHEMPNYGCCGQGLAIPNRHLAMLEDRFLQPPFLIAGDALIEEIANEDGFRKLALVPSVLQHVGVRGSSAPGGKIRKTFNFSFERLRTT